MSGERELPCTTTETVINVVILILILIFVIIIIIITIIILIHILIIIIIIILILILVIIIIIIVIIFVIVVIIINIMILILFIARETPVDLCWPGRAVRPPSSEPSVTRTAVWRAAAGCSAGRAVGATSLGSRTTSTGSGTSYSLLHSVRVDQAVKLFSWK